ncbi:DUF6443 domain-containing protein [Emticicia sp. TH156]|uniref:DUF6443 domain-containing protein n=1 Tax=Emticicia sp. TH156 TaxID=2067454 RepID=UPI000C792883|nr:DUF6443 domain-containing protein [Emticicia sp. TH156]PLK44213.1 hypothetical protein C0V77_10455 [Emticicia sp. TH156]
MKNLHRYIFFIASVVFCPPSKIWGQTIPGDRNAVIHSKFRVATTTEADATDPAKALINIGYADGLGRDVQTIGYQQSPTNKDIVSNAVEFDKYGRVIRTALVAPTSSTTGTYQNSAFSLASSFYGDSYAFSATTSFDNSPLNRGREQYGAGNAWRTATKRVQSFDEAAGTDVRYYYLDGSGNIILSGNYPNNSLFKKRTIDEQGHTSIEISDTRGRLIQKQIQDDTGFITTYYLYDGMGRIVAVIQPQGYELNTGILKNSAEWQKWVFGYEYDYRGRMHLKQVPAAGDEYMVYDKWDRLVWSQTALQREAGKWTFYKYDAFNREIIRGEKSESRGLAAMETEAWAWAGSRYESRTTSGIYYSYSNGYPQLFTDADIRQITYYDNYTDWVPAGMAFANGGTAFHTQYTEAQGSMVGSRSRSGVNNNWLVSVLYYDNKGRAIRTLSQNLFSQIEQLDTEYNQAGEILQVKKIHKNQSGTATTEITQNELDHTGRAKKVFHGIGITPIEVVRNTYDEIGRLTRKKIMPNNTYVASGTNIDGLQTIDLAYHLRGSLRGINLDNSGNAVPNSSEGDLFSYKLDYETAGFYDGNIGKQYWQGVNASNVATGIRDYTFAYDAAKRLASASYNIVNGENYSLSGITYDKNGNIKTLNRKGKSGTPPVGSTFGDIDILNYNYNGNQLNQVTDAVSGDHDVDFVPRGSGNYTYYTDGSLKSNENEGITLILYDTYLKQPKEIQLTGARKINYYYDGAGALLKTVYSTGEYWEYAGIIYKNGQPYQMPIPEGRAVYVSGAWQNEFFYTDHLGNTRVAYKANGTALTKTSETSFDPWGVVLKDAGLVNTFQNRFEYQNKEKESTFNLRRISFGARTYNASIGRFDGVDVLADEPEQVDKGPYTYNWNNPIRNIDPDGRAVTPLIGAILGAAVEYGTQVATNALKNGKLDSDAFTKNINFTAIGLAAAEGAATQGASAGRKLLAKAAVTVANNVVSVGIDDNGQFKGTVETNGANVVKNTALDAMSDLATGGVLNPIVKGKASNVIKKAAGSEGNKLASGVKTILRKSGVDITRKVNNTVKQTSKNIVKQVPEKIGDAAENTVKIVTSKPKDEIKEKGNF